jgi:hypothetical protein
MTAATKWAWVWYLKQFEKKWARADQADVALSLCPDFAREFSSDRARNAFPRKVFDERVRGSGPR